MSDNQELQAFDELRHWCQKYGAVIYSECDGSVRIQLIKDKIDSKHSFYIADIITAKKETWKLKEITFRGIDL